MSHDARDRFIAYYVVGVVLVAGFVAVAVTVAVASMLGLP